MDIQPHIDEWYSYCDEFSTGNDPKSLQVKQLMKRLFEVCNIYYTNDNKKYEKLTEFLEKRSNLTKDHENDVLDLFKLTNNIDIKLRECKGIFRAFKDIGIKIRATFIKALKCKITTLNTQLVHLKQNIVNENDDTIKKFKIDIIQIQNKHAVEMRSVMNENEMLRKQLKERDIHHDKLLQTKENYFNETIKKNDLYYNKHMNDKEINHKEIIEQREKYFKQCIIDKDNNIDLFKQMIMNQTRN
jgi:hypothetical protein